MKRQLFLLRHAKSSWDDPTLQDHERPLSKRGRKAAAAMGKLMRSREIVPDLVLVSSARRTMETLEALQPWHPLPTVKVKDSLYHATAPEMLDMLRAVEKSARTVLLVGHNPGLHELAVALAGEGQAESEDLARRMANAYPTGALARFAVDDSWSKIEEAVRLTDFIIPRELTSAK